MGTMSEDEPLDLDPELAIERKAASERALNLVAAWRLGTEEGYLEKLEQSASDVFAGGYREVAMLLHALARVASRATLLLAAAEHIAPAKAFQIVERALTDETDDG
jgi:hypothetical protein